MEKSDQEEKSWSMASRTATQNRDGLEKKRNGFTVPSGEKNWCAKSWWAQKFDDNNPAGTLRIIKF